jgi:hypothetical protein
MVKISGALQAKSDQLNALDLVGSPLTIIIERVEYYHGKEQPVEIFYHGNKLPWRPAKCMLRLLSSYWTDETENWVGKTVELYFEPSVLWAGKADGGIRVSGLSNIEKSEQVRVKEGRNRFNIYDIKKLSPAKKTTTEPTKTEPTSEQKEAAAEKAKINLLNNIEAISEIEHVAMFLQSEANQSVLKRLQDGYPDKHTEVMTALQNKENQFKE